MMTASASNVFIIHDDKVYKSIQSFLKKKRNDKTRTEYIRDIENYFKWLLPHKGLMKKELKYLIENDLVINQEMFEDYRSYMMDELDLGSSSVKKATSAIRGLYTYLAANDYAVKSDWFRALEKLEDDKMEYEAFTYVQALRAMEVVKPTEKGDVKYCLIKTACFTSFRIGELMKLTKRSFKFIDNVWTLGFTKKVGKRNKENRQAIPFELYDELMALIEKYDHPDGRIFKLSKNTITKMMKLIRKELDLEAPEDQNEDEEEGRYVFHSFRKCGVTEVAIITNGNVDEIQKQANHADARDSINIYTKVKRNYSNSPNLKMGQTMNILPDLEELSKEEIIKLIGKCSSSVHFELGNLLK